MENASNRYRDLLRDRSHDKSRDLLRDKSHDLHRDLHSVSVELLLVRVRFVCTHFGGFQQYLWLLRMILVCLYVVYMHA